MRSHRFGVKNGLENCAKISYDVRPQNDPRIVTKLWDSEDMRPKTRERCKSECDILRAKRLSFPEVIPKMKHKLRAICAPLVFLCVLASVQGATAQVNPNFYAGLQWRSVGPFHGGRISSVSGVAGDPGTFYMGTPLGGIWKTTSAGVTWFPIFDQETSVDSIGAIQVAPSAPSIIYAGAGDPIGGSLGTPALHTPLMAVTNAISAIVIVGAMLATGLTIGGTSKFFGTLAVLLAAVNVFGGFLVTRRMLEMFKKKEPKKLPSKEGA